MTIDELRTEIISIFVNFLANRGFQFDDTDIEPLREPIRAALEAGMNSTAARYKAIIDALDPSGAWRVLSTHESIVKHLEFLGLTAEFVEGIDGT